MRSNRTGSLLALAAVLALALGLRGTPEVASAATLPPSVEAAVLAAAEVDSSGATSIEMVRAEAVTWSDGCLGYYPPGAACTLALVDGYVVWVVADAQGLRYHTNANGSAVILAGSIGPSMIAGAPLPEGALPRTTEGGLISGEVPAPGSIGLLVVLEAATPEAVSGALLASGCSVETLATLDGGVWRVWIVGAPSAANAPFAAAFEAGLPPLTPFFVRCRPEVPPPGSGVLGRVTLGPLCPVQQLGVPCPDEPFSAALVVLDAANVQVASAVSGTDGRYAIALEAGPYTMVPFNSPQSPFPFAGPVAFEVLSGQWLTLDISYDTGIR